MTTTMMMMMILSVLAARSREGPIKFAEASMFNGYGLKYIHKFFSLPFLYLQVGVDATENDGNAFHARHRNHDVKLRLAFA